jgi:DNA-directed RNA polymerase subunit RPC12/RpoP
MITKVDKFVHWNCGGEFKPTGVVISGIPTFKCLKCSKVMNEKSTVKASPELAPYPINLLHNNCGGEIAGMICEASYNNTSRFMVCTKCEKLIHDIDELEEIQRPSRFRLLYEAKKMLESMQKTAQEMEKLVEFLTKEKEDVST